MKFCLELHRSHRLSLSLSVTELSPGGTKHSNLAKDTLIVWVYASALLLLDLLRTELAIAIDITADGCLA